MFNNFLELGHTTQILTIVWLFSTIVVFIYAAIFIFLLIASVVLIKKSKYVAQSEVISLDSEYYSAQDITVIIPSHNEGKILLNAIRSIYGQDYKAHIYIYIVFKDGEDNSISALKDELSTRGFEEKRTTKILFCQKSNKVDKLNFGINLTNSEYIAFLDADHVADINWISNSIHFLNKNSSICAVQGIRRPLNTRGIFSINDTIQCHMGNEIFNMSIDYFSFSSMFTGTTAVFRRQVFNNLKFEDCLTEDTLLSARLIINGQNIQYSSQAGSSEELSPSLLSYFTRRRRWASGHTKSLIKILRSTLKNVRSNTREKIRILLVGQFYLFPFWIWLILLMQSIFIILQLHFYNLLILILATISMSILSQIRYLKRANIPLFSTILFMFPHVVLSYPFFLKSTDYDLYTSILEFPFIKDFIYIHLFAACIPLILGIFLAFKFKYLNIWQTACYIFSYPIFLIIDTYAIFIGLCDLVVSHQKWIKNERSGLTEKIFKKKFFTFQSLILTAILICTIPAIIIINETLSTNRCGKISGPLYDFIFFPEKKHGIEWLISSQKKLNDTSIELSFSSIIESNSDEYTEFKIINNDNTVWMGKNNLYSALKINEILPIHFSAKKFIFYLYGKKSNSNNFQRVCEKEINVKQYEVKINNGNLLLNDEPFIIKCIAPTFFAAKNKISSDIGFAQIKGLNANSVRLYRPASQNNISAALTNELFIIDQIERSNWDEINFRNIKDISMFLNSANKSLYSNVDSHLLLRGLGNELELSHPDIEYRELIDNYLAKVCCKDKDQIFSYSTDKLLNNFNTDAIGINAVVSSHLYWDEMLPRYMKYHRNQNKLYYASEFGINFNEPNNFPFHLFKVNRDWNRINEEGFSGGCLLASHDNWSTPIYHRYNDPITASDIDDTRGIWDVYGKKREEFSQVVSNIYSDLEFMFDDKYYILKNLSPYKLTNIKFISSRNSLIKTVPQVNPYSTMQVDSIKSDQLSETAKIYYDSHRMIHHEMTKDYCNPKSLVPCMLSGKLTSTYSELTYNFRKYENSDAKIYVPQNWCVDNHTVSKIHNFTRPIIITPTFQLFNSATKSYSNNLDDEKLRRAGNLIIKLRYKIPIESELKDTFLVLSNIGADNITIEYGKMQMKRINYKTDRIEEFKIKMSDLPEVMRSGELIIRVNNRVNLMWNHMIEFQRPYFLDLTPLKIRRCSQM